MKTSGHLFIVAAPSGAGKTTLVRALLKADPRIKLSISYTTRPPRPGEADGVDYHFVNEEQFLAMMKAGEFLESAKVHGGYYGTSQAWAENVMRQGDDLLLEIDWQGAAQVRKIFPNAVSIFILPPSEDALRERLNKRGQDSDEVIARRLANAHEEIQHVAEFDYVIINTVFDDALRDLQAVFLTQRLRVEKQLVRHAAVINNFSN
ncbi:MAG: guanylate kinase [Methylophilales bacterium]|nr:guanylate kinase [Methylophilales bacterium]